MGFRASGLRVLYELRVAVVDVCVMSDVQEDPSQVVKGAGATVQIDPLDKTTSK